MPKPTLNAVCGVFRSRTNGSPSLLTSAAAAYRRVPHVEMFIVLALLVCVAAAAASSLHYPVMPVTLVSAGASALVHVTVRRPAAILTCALLAVFASLSPLVASAYLTAMGNADYGLVLNLCVAATIVAILAHHTSVGRAPLTVAAALLALAVAGPALAFVAPSLGAANGYLLAGIVVFARTRRWGTPTRRARAVKDVNADSAAALTATLLTGLPDTFTVLTDVAVPRTGRRAQHIVIGPTGVTLVTSMAQPGIVREHPTRGLELDGSPLAPLVTPVLDLARAVAAALDLSPDDVTPVLVMHGARLSSPHTVVALVSADGNDTGQVHVSAPDRLLAQINPEDLDPDDATSATTVGVLVKRARKFRSRTVSATTPEATERSVTVLDESGRPKPFTDPGNPMPMFRSTSVDSTMLVGQAAALITDQGTFSGYRVVSAPQPDDTGTILVAVCTENEWRDAKDDGRDTTSFPYPLASVTSA